MMFMIMSLLYTSLQPSQNSVLCRHVDIYKLSNIYYYND